MTIAAAEVFEQQVWPAAEVRAKLEKTLQQVEDQRLQAWILWRAAPKDTQAATRYQTLCKEQARLMAAVEEWKRANPEEEGD